MEPFGQKLHLIKWRTLHRRSILLNESEEAAAIRGCKAGDKEAFRALAEQYERMLFGIAYLMTRDRDLAADAVQETFLKMWKHISSLRAGNGLKAWLARILVNEVKQLGRKKQVPTVPIELASGMPDGADSIEIEMERGELREAVRKALRMLPREQAEAVVLRYFGGLTLTEIAFAMGCREGTVKSRLSRALGRLKSILREEAIDARQEVD
jgi:RNA polymerase sigma-70 factor (ECF subfamily)